MPAFLPDVPLLSLILALPLGAALALCFLPERHARWLALGSMLLTLLMSGLVLAGFTPDGPRYQWLEEHLWIAGLGIHYRVGVDGLSVLFLPSTALLFLGTLCAHWQRASEAPRLHWGLLLLLQTALLGVFCALDSLLFFLFWELTLPPLYFLLGRFGCNGEAARAAPRYALIMLASGIPLLFAILLAASGDPAAGFDITRQQGEGLSFGQQQAVFLLFLLAFAVKVPLFPFHTWLPQFALAAPGSLTALLMGLKIGVYGLYRLAIPFAPAAAQDLHWLLAGLGTVSLLYGAVGLLAQTNLRVGLAYLGMSHVGFAIIGLSAFSAQGVHGAASLLLSFAVASGGAYLLLEFLRQRTGSNDVGDLGGLAGALPRLSAGLLVCGLAGLGFPGASSFPGEFLLLLAVLESHTGAGMAALFGLGIAAAGFLALYRRAFFGPPRHADGTLRDLLPREQLVLAVIIVLAFGIGLYPAPWLDILRPAAEQWALGLR